MKFKNPFKKQVQQQLQENSKELKKTGLNVSTGNIKDMLMRQQLNINNRVASGTEKLADEIITKKADELQKHNKLVNKENLMAGYSTGLNLIGLSKGYLEQRVELFLNPSKEESVKPAKKK